MTTQTSNKTKGNGKKFLVYAIMVIIFIACMWFIFAPSGADKAAEEQGSGFNSEIPDPRGAGIVDDKMTAYEQEQMRIRDEQQRVTMRDYSDMLRQNETEEERLAREERQIAMAPKPVEYYEHPEWWDDGGTQSHGGAISSSASAHAELTGTLGTFFEEPEIDPEKEEMAAEIERLNAQVAEQQATEMSMDDQLALMERSYELAALYENGGATTATEPVEVGPDRKALVEVVPQVQRDVVSRLGASMSDAEFVRQFSQERNRGFNTVGNDDAAVDTKNTIAAVVHGNQTLIDGQTVRLRTTEAMRAGRITIPRNTVITGTGSITGEWLEIAVTAIEYEGNIIPVEIAVCDSDGQQGIYIPGSMEIEAFKEIAGNMGQGLGTTINLNQQGAGEQLLTDLGRGVIQGTSQYISKKAQQVKVSLKAGYRLFLLPATNA
ncbi:MAG: conjugative transposon protein TraM [Alistipes sp.]|jgi:conjugative transposon TraM protein|nr:conjugative transposon protein TraM [Alistipes sp.]